MSGDVKVSASEQARQDAIKAAQKKGKAKAAETAGSKHAADTGQAQGKGKAMKSAFDNVLDTISQQQASLIPPETKFDTRLKQVQHDEDRSRKDDEGKEDKKTKDKGEKSHTTRESGKGVKGRVDAKHGLKGQSGGSSDQQEGQFKKGSQQKSPGADPTKKQLGLAQQTVAPPPIFQTQPVSNVEAPKADYIPREIPKALLDQIIQYVRIGRDKELNKEIQIDFHDNFFNGLKLKVTAKGKEICVEFLVPNRDVQATFKEEREGIASALGEKGIEVRSIDVTML